MIRVTLLLVATLLGVACQIRTPDDVEPAPPAPAPADGGVAPASCSSACTHQRALRCELGQPTPEGSTCEEVCENVETSGVESIRWDLVCLTSAPACDSCDR